MKQSSDEGGGRLRDPRTPDELLNYRLMRLFALAGAPVVRLCEGRYGVTRREFRLLCLVVAHGPLSPSRLGELAHLDAARASRVIAALIDKGMIRRDVDGQDRRCAVVAATPVGEALHRQLFPQIAQINGQMVSVLTPAQLASLDEILQVLTQHADALNGSIVLDARADRSRGRERERERVAPD